MIGLTTSSVPDKPPSLRQQKILDAFYEKPVAAAVAREQGCDEKTVRDLVKKYSAHLEERRRDAATQRQLERNASRSALESRLTQGLDPALRTLQELMGAESESVRLQAARAWIDYRMRLADHLLPGETRSQLDRLGNDHVADLERELAEIGLDDAGEEAEGTAA